MLHSFVTGRRGAAPYREAFESCAVGAGAHDSPHKSGVAFPRNTSSDFASLSHLLPLEKANNVAELCRVDCRAGACSRRFRGDVTSFLCGGTKAPPYENAEICFDPYNRVCVGAAVRRGRRTLHPLRRIRRHLSRRAWQGDVRSIFGRGGACSSRTKHCYFPSEHLIRPWLCHSHHSPQGKARRRCGASHLLPITSYLKKHLISQVLFSHLLSSISRRYRSDSIQYS